MGSTALDTDAQKLAADVAKRVEAERALAAAAALSLMVIVGGVVAALSMLLLQGLDAATHVQVLIALGLAIGAINCVDVWFLRKRLEAAITLLRSLETC